MTLEEIRKKLKELKDDVNTLSFEDWNLGYVQGAEDAYSKCLELLSTIESYEEAKTIKNDGYIDMAYAISEMCGEREDCKGCPLEKVEGMCLPYFTPNDWDF